MRSGGHNNADGLHGRRRSVDGLWPGLSSHLLASAGVGAFDCWRPLNISSMRSVTTNPPTTLVVARVTATRPRTIVTGESAPAAMGIAPTRVMPWMALL